MITHNTKTTDVRLNDESRYVNKLNDESIFQINKIS